MENITKLLNRVKNKTILIVFPHPDDESIATGGLIQKAKISGYEVTLLTLTQGGAGKICINPNGKSLKELRTEELKKASTILGIDNLIIRDYDDGKLKQRNGWNMFVNETIRKYKPGIIATYDPTGITGHPDHINVSVGIKKIVSEIAINKPVLLWVTFKNKTNRNFVDPSIRQYMTDPDFELTLSYGEIFKKMRAMFCHKSQKYENLFSLLIGMIISKKEWYHKVNISNKYPYKYINYKI